MKHASCEKGLIELIVVLLMLAILMALLFPALELAKRQAIEAHKRVLAARASKETESALSSSSLSTNSSPTVAAPTAHSGTEGPISPQSMLLLLGTAFAVFAYLYRIGITSRGTADIVRDCLATLAANDSSIVRDDKHALERANRQNSRVAQRNFRKQSCGKQV
jgi:type II secretory pathway pseudopilin PulG